MRLPSSEPVGLPQSTQVRSPADTVVGTPGFTLVEEDDVAFSLQLCREVHRIYGEYQDGRLPPGDSMLAGLVVTMEMLAVLSRTVRDGMPGMRITVAAAQTREMLAVAFGQDPMQKPVQRRLREQYRFLVAEAVGAVGGGPDSAVPAARSLEPPADGPRAAAEPAPRRSRLMRLFGRRRG